MTAPFAGPVVDALGRHVRSHRVTYADRMSIGTVHLLYGLAGSGKSTLARELCANGAGVRFTLDEWMLRLHPELSIEDPAYGEHAAVVRDLIWSLAAQVLATGAVAVLDWNSWSVERRAWVRERAQDAGADVVLHVLTTGIEEATSRAAAREAAGATLAHRITREGNEHLASLLQPPSADEGLEIIRH